MYKLLLCWRYLRTRYIALASIVSVMLGVATMIVVNSVMAGFTSEMQNRIHGILSDLSFESYGMDGMRDAQWHSEQIAQVAGDQIAGMTPTVVVPGMLHYWVADKMMTRQVQIIGIDEKTQGLVSDFPKYLQHPENRRQLSFELRKGGYDTRDHQAGPDAAERVQMQEAGWERRIRVAQLKAFQERYFSAASATDATGNAANPAVPLAADPPPTDTNAVVVPPTSATVDPFAAHAAPAQEASLFNPARQQHTGVVLGLGLVNYRPQGEDRFLALPGDDVILTVPKSVTGLKPIEGISDHFTIVDLYESKMSEYDASFVFVPIRRLQQLRGMIEPTTGVGFVNSIQIRLKPGVNGDEVRDKLRAVFNPKLYGIETWRDKQGALLAAVQMETAILNVLLFLIIAVAGFGILAIFLMIVVEKTRDIGILKSLGASGRGVMGIFLAYGLSLGTVGSVVGTVTGLLVVRYINQIAAFIGWVRGQPVFDPRIYYFYKIPTIVNPWTITWIVAGAMTIAVLASVLPAIRAALLHPVEALRYE
jgi:lipoprotein-releasing system permease protein